MVQFDFSLPLFTLSYAYKARYLVFPFLYFSKNSLEPPKGAFPPLCSGTKIAQTYFFYNPHHLFLDL